MKKPNYKKWLSEFDGAAFKGRVENVEVDEENFEVKVTFAVQAWDEAEQIGDGTHLRVVIDESPFAARFAGDASLAPRVEERRQLWRNFVAGYGLEADLLPLEELPFPPSR